MKLTSLTIFGHWWVLLIGILTMVRSVFSLVDRNNRGLRLMIWALVMMVGLFLIIASVATIGYHPHPKHVTTHTN